ncbi:MAG: NADPH-dependent glutamate synthase [Chitinivibrionales bacterium]|nr:NADPH-dependent glutamate synthase [Chitinivibrionales bacterium]
MPARQVMPHQDPKKRVANFNEVALGYSEETALTEASRCLNCKKPLCMQGCPVEVDIPSFIQKIKEGKFDQAIALIKEKNNLPAVCGRVCPQEGQCEKFCILGKKGQSVAIGRLERYVADREIGQAAKASAVAQVKYPDQRIGVVGSGPAGLTCAADLAKMGYPVTIFEVLHATGGVLRYGIPEFRLPKKIVDIEVDYIKGLGVDIKLNVVIGKTLTLDDLREEGYKAFFVGTGAGLPNFLGIEGENLIGVYSANEFLTRTNLMKAYKFPEYDTPLEIGKRVAVVGAGNVAMDSARCALRLGAEEVSIVYRRSREEMPARLEEIENAEEEGVKLSLLTTPLKIIGDKDGFVTGMQCLKNELGEPDDSGRRKPVPIKGSEYILPLDTVVCAIGQGPNPLLLSSLPHLTLNRRGNIVADDNCRTSINDVFAGGDIVTGAATVIEAMGAGKRAARAMDAYLQKQK